MRILRARAVLYVIILSAALDLVPPSTPKGIIAFCNIAPSLIAKVGWPYLLKGRIRYEKRLAGCCLLSSFGMVVSLTFSVCHHSVSEPLQVVAAFDSLEMRLLGIGLASLSSGMYLLWILFAFILTELGLGELTFLQLSTRYHPSSVAGHSVGYVDFTGNLSSI